MGFTIDIGGRGEEAAARWLLDNGYRILHRNWRSGRYELDIVATKGDTLHIVEVKCRRKGSLTAPTDAATPAKFRSLAKAAEHYIAAYGIDLEVEFSLASVEYDNLGTEVTFIPNAMYPSW